MDDHITVNNVPVEEYLGIKKDEKIAEESTQIYNQNLHRSTQDKSTLKRSRHTARRAGQSIQKADTRNMKTSEKRSRVTHYNQWDMVINGEVNMAHQAIINILQDSSRWNIFDVDMLMGRLKEEVELPPKIDQLKFIVRQLILDETVNPYCFLQGEYVPYKQGSKKKIHFILATKDDERENFLAMSDVNLRIRLEAFGKFCEDLFGPFEHEYVSLVKKEPMKHAAKAGNIYNHTMARKLCQLGEPVTMSDLLESFQSNGYPMKDNGTIRAILARFKEKDLIDIFIKKHGEFSKVPERPRGEKAFYRLKGFDDLPLKNFMPKNAEAPVVVPADTPDGALVEVPPDEEVVAGLPQAVESYDDIINILFPVQSDSNVTQYKAGNLRGKISSYIAGREVFDILRSAGKVVSSAEILKELRNRGYTKITTVAVRSALNKLQASGLSDFYQVNAGKARKVETPKPGSNINAKFKKPSATVPEALSPAESLSETGSDDEQLSVASQPEQPIATIEPIKERPVQPGFEGATMDSFVDMLKANGVKRFEIEF